MNQREDWDIIWRWQWFRAPVWQPYFRDPSHPEGRVARSAPIWGWVLEQSGAKSVLDCNAGIGLRAILLQEAGFEMSGSDLSPVGIEHARELAASRGQEIDFQCCMWHELTEKFKQKFDAVINDAFAQTLTRTELRFAIQNFASVLKPGGVLIFTGADQWSSEEDRAAMIEHSWQAAPRFQLRNDYERDGMHMTLLVVRDRTDQGIIENYLFMVRDDAGPRLECATISNSVRWTWNDFKTICEDAGFNSLESVKVKAGRREHIFNVARK